jgi:hypothetical protein
MKNIIINKHYKIVNQKGGIIDPNKLNHPWYVYPRGEYIDNSLYKLEIIRLINFLEDLEKKIDKITLFNIILGTMFEEKNNPLPTLDEITWQQLFPYHIQKLYEDMVKNNNKGFIQIIIISPDDFINKETYIPRFANKIYNKNFNFIKERKGVWIHNFQDITIKVDIFCCPMPSIDIRFNLKDEFKKRFGLDEKLKPNIYDYCCVNKFYSLLDHLTQKILTVINNWVKFLNPGSNLWPNEFDMFLELKKIINKNKIITTLWLNTFIVCDSRYIIYKNFKYSKEYSYINSNINKSLSILDIKKYPSFIISDIICENKKNNTNFFQAV